ncbi:hypothetical protein O3M35_005508 [Rhynocoris fuscipes]|uniref:Uncharacterized protein n=1 Tax=Rhynocoris fuscipes TaxID=488301 RepID=A0AAW1DIW7_9HEMI
MMLFPRSMMIWLHYYWIIMLISKLLTTMDSTLYTMLLFVEIQGKSLFFIQSFKTYWVCVSLMPSRDSLWSKVVLPTRTVFFYFIY